MRSKSAGNPLDTSQREKFLEQLAARFTQHMNRHQDLQWPEVLARLEVSPSKLWSLHEMERTGGEPDVVGFDQKSGELVFFDCSAETPKGRCSACYDRAGLDSRKAHKPEHNAVDLAATMGITMLNEAEYQMLQELGEFDLKTSSWILTPKPIRALGGALFGERRYGQVFIFHNGAQSYFGARGFRGVLRV